MISLKLFDSVKSFVRMPRMSELSAKITALKGSRKTSDLLAGTEISRGSFRALELGKSVKLSTLREIAALLGADEAQWIDLLVAWLKHEAGGDEEKLWIEPKAASTSVLHGVEESQVARAMMLFKNLNAADRMEITKAMKRAEVRACLPAINSVWEKFGPSESDGLTRPDA